MQNIGHKHQTISSFIHQLNNFCDAIERQEELKDVLEDVSQAIGNLRAARSRLRAMQKENEK